MMRTSNERGISALRIKRQALRKNISEKESAISEKLHLLEKESWMIALNSILPTSWREASRVVTGDSLGSLINGFIAGFFKDEKIKKATVRPLLVLLLTGLTRIFQRWMK